MESVVLQLRGLCEELEANPHIVVRGVPRIGPPIPRSELEELEQALEVRFPEALKDFYTHAGEVSIGWGVNKATLEDRLSEEDANYLAGSIDILSPLTMVQGLSGHGWKRGGWKDLLWFDFMTPEDQEAQRRFFPFDMPEGNEIMVGYCHDSGILEPALSLRDDGEIEGYELTLAQYLERMVKAKGYMYWQRDSIDDQSAEYQRFIRSMAATFPTFDAEFFRGSPPR